MSEPQHEQPSVQQATDADAPAVAGARRAHQATAPAGRRRGALRPALIGLLALLVLAGAGFLIYQATNQGGYRVGDCVVISEKKPNLEANFRKTSCEDHSKFSYQVAIINAADQQCPNGEREVYESYRSETGNGKGTVCLAPNLVKGSCYSLMDPYSAVDCGDAKATLRVLDRLNVADATKCSSEQAWAYPSLKLTYCLEQKQQK